MAGEQAQTEIPSELRWRCRRGMRELDVLLSRWLETRWTASTSRQQAAFARLLGSEDDQLWDWLLGRARPADPELQGIVDDIRAGH